MGISPFLRFGLPLATLAVSLAVVLPLWNAINSREKQNALLSFNADRQAKFQDIEDDFERTLNTTYDALRTMAMLPGVSRISRHAENFQGDSKESVQQLYNNIASQVAVSEIYIVPADLDPDVIDPVTGKNQTPITTFDQVIVGKSADTAKKSDDELEEVEIYEYRQMKQQCAFFRAHYPNFSTIQKLNFPAVVSREVITCDNTEFSRALLKAGDNSARMGIVYSVPFFGPDGNFKGLVSAVMRTRVLQRLLYDPYFVIEDAGTGYAIDAAGAPTHMGLLLQTIHAGKMPRDLAFTQEIACDVVSDTPWNLICAVPWAEFQATPAMRSAATHSRLVLLFGLLVSSLLSTTVWFLSTSRSRAILLAREMTSSLRASENEMRELNNVLRAATEAAEAASYAKSEFLARMSHEIRTPLNGVVGMIDLLEHSAVDNNQRRYLQLAREASGSLLAVISDILDFSKIEAGKVELEKIEYDPHKLVEDLILLLAPVAAKKNLAMASLLRPDVPHRLLGDPNRIRQILTNLLSNAIKFTERGSVSLRVVVDRRETDSITLRLEVCDTGIGIPADRLDRLFERFSQVDSSTTRRYGGTGLGLAISKRLVNLMGGDIGAISMEGAGTTFWFTLCAEEVVARDTLPDSPAAALRAVRLFAIEPNPVLRKILAEQLDGRFSPDSRVIGDEAPLPVLRDAAASGHLFEIALLPYNDSGHAIAAEIRAENAIKTVRCVAMLNIDDRIEPAELARKGFDGFLHRPIMQSHLVDIVASLTVARTPVASPPPANQSSAAAALKGLHLLVAEDNEMNQFVTSETLRRAECTFQIVADGSEAVNAAQNSRFDAILMDCQMPNMDGLEATRLIRRWESDSSRPRTPIIALTADAISGDREKCLSAGMDGYVTKPINTEELFAAISALTGPARPAPRIGEPAPPSTAPGDSPIDLETVLSRCMGDAQFVDDTLHKFSRRAREDLDLLRASLNIGDTERTRMVARSLKSVAAQVSATEMRRLAVLLEDAATRYDLDDIADALSRLAIETQRCNDFIADTVRKRTGSPKPSEASASLR
jgi:Amt family ammonium transporter